MQDLTKLSGVCVDLERTLDEGHGGSPHRWRRHLNALVTLGDTRIDLDIEGGSYYGQDSEQSHDQFDVLRERAVKAMQGGAS